MATIFMVMNEFALRNELEDALLKKDHEVIVNSNPSDARLLFALYQKEIALACIDHMFSDPNVSEVLPRPDGLPFARNIAHKYPEVAVILLTEKPAAFTIDDKVGLQIVDKSGGLNSLLNAINGEIAKRPRGGGQPAPLAPKA